ncbi:hypothetical protein CBR_g44376 [Chara braunii]|uniref:Uncharacterized protein n=1 Tax=Chara braunii TaxID=69332 RepID=A0A388LXD8_CHABU|nr:hypothetical protein CBR_g44376 [Chara braunii]|eukprot:GBG86921.1 hypothetical protein CBR_g44376 [Chara braunii]
MWRTFRERLSWDFACDEIVCSVEDLKEMKREERETFVTFARRFEKASELLMERGFISELDRCAIFIGTLPIEKRKFVMRNMSTKRLSFAQIKALALQTEGPDVISYILDLLEKLGKGVSRNHLEKQFGDEGGREFRSPNKSKEGRDSVEWKEENRGDWKKNGGKWGDARDRCWRCGGEEEDRRRLNEKEREALEEIKALRVELERMERMNNVSPRRSAESLKILLQQESKDRRQKGPEKTVELNEWRKIKCADDEKDISCRPSTKMNTDITTETTQEVIQEIQGEIWVSSIRFEENRYANENEEEDILYRTSTEINIGIKTRTTEEAGQGEFWVSSVRFEEDLDANDNLTIGVSSVQFECSKEDPYTTSMCAKEVGGQSSKDRTDDTSLDIDVAPKSEEPMAISKTLVDRTMTMRMTTIDEEREALKDTKDTQDKLIEDQDEKCFLNGIVGAEISQIFEVMYESGDNYEFAQMFETVEPDVDYELA